MTKRDSARSNTKFTSRSAELLRIQQCAARYFAESKRRAEAAEQAARDTQQTHLLLAQYLLYRF